MAAALSEDPLGFGDDMALWRGVEADLDYD
jgi:hypothetical protein